MSNNRSKQLASDGRAGMFARRKARVDQRAYVRKNWRWLFGSYFALVGIGAAPVLFVDGAFWSGLWLGLVLAGVAGVIVMTVVIQTGTDPTMAGELAEQWTAQELRPLEAHGYRLANHVNVDSRGDADHVLIGPGGLFVLETKWSATEWTSDRFFADPLRKVAERARNTFLQLTKHGVPAATPVLVLWGQAAKPLTAATGVRKHDDAVVIAGSHLQRWLLGRAPAVLNPQQIDAAFHTVCGIAERADRHEASVPPSVERLFWLGVAAAAAWMTSLLLSLWTIKIGWFAYAATTFGLLLLIAILWKRLSRWLATATGAGAACSLLLVLLAVAYDVLRQSWDLPMLSGSR